MNTLKHYKIFIASPGGLVEERKAFREIINEFNEIDAIDRGFYFQPIGWEDTLGHQGRPQDIINEDLRKCDYMFLVLHNRWGSPSSIDSKFSSGTEEEFHIGIECLNDDQFPLLRIAIFFKDVSKEQLADPGLQLSRVLAFKKEREEKKDFLFETFDAKESFEKQIKFHLSKIVRELEKENNSKKNKVSSNIDTTFKDADFEWLNVIMKYNNWDLAYAKAQEYLKSGKSIEAELIFSQITQRSNNPFLIARYAKYLRKQGRIHSSKDLLLTAEKMAVALKDYNSTAYCKRQLGRIEEYKGNMKSALDLFISAKDIYQENDNELSVARTLRDIGYVLNKLGKSEDAIEMVNRSIIIYKSRNDLQETAASLSYLGMIYKDLGEFELAIESHEKALTIQKECNNLEALANIYSNMAVIHRLKGNDDEALVLHEKALVLFEKVDNKRGIAREYANIGVVLRRQGKYNESIEKHFFSIEIEERYGNERGLQIQYGNIGLNYIELKEYENSEYYFHKALEISRKLDDLKGESHQHKNFCMLYLKKKEYEKATDEILQAFKLDEMSKNKYGLASCHRLYGEILLATGQTNKGLEELKTAKNLYLEMKLLDLVSEMEQIAIAFTA